MHYPPLNFNSFLSIRQLISCICIELLQKVAKTVAYRFSKEFCANPRNVLTKDRKGQLHSLCSKELGNSKGWQYTFPNLMTILPNIPSTITFIDAAYRLAKVSTAFHHTNCRGNLDVWYAVIRLYSQVISHALQSDPSWRRTQLSWPWAHLLTNFWAIQPTGREVTDFRICMCA
jgi:hypothetical protein